VASPFFRAWKQQRRPSAYAGPCYQLTSGISSFVVPSFHGLTDLAHPIYFTFADFSFSTGRCLTLSGVLWSEADSKSKDVGQRRIAAA
jgi:hypothetical protein